MTLRPLIARRVIQVRWRDRIKLLFTGKFVLYLGKKPGAPAGVEIYGAGV